MRQIKFKRVFFTDEAKTKFSHSCEWGVKLDDYSYFTSPSTNNFAFFYTDYQFIGLTDKQGKEICEGDIVMHAGWICVVGYKDSAFMLFDAKGICDTVVITQNVASKFIDIIGNSYESPEKLKTA